MRRIDLIIGVVCVALGVVGIMSTISAFSYYSWHFVLGGGEKAENAMVFYNLGPSVPNWFLWLFPLVLFFFRREATNLIGDVVEKIAAE